ncbi:unnamed protein product [Boreogadus saida]
MRYLRVSIQPLSKKYDSSEYLNITGITRDQSGDYECSALNDIAFPDTKTVRVTVNSLRHLGSVELINHTAGKMDGVVCSWQLNILV